MANRDVFSKILPNVKLGTRYDEDGREVQVERREDSDATAKEQDTFDILVAAGYYRARIKGLSAFDKVVGGMTWCIECCDYGVDVDLLFHESLSIGQKIALVEKIVSVLIDMKCPHSLEPHQVQGLEFLAIHPVIQWLVKTSFHNHYQYKSDKDNLTKIRLASTHIKAIQELYGPRRLYERQESPGDDDDVSRVRLTLLEYGDPGPMLKSSAGRKVEQGPGETAELDLEEYLRSLSLAKDDLTGTQKRIDLDPTARQELQKHYAEFKLEMETDAQDLKAQNQQKRLEAAKIALEHKIQSSLKRFKTYLQQHEELKKSEAEFKESCRTDLATLQQQIDDLEAFSAQDAETQAAALAGEEQRLKELRLQLAKRNRGIVAIERKLDAIPDRTELAQYQRRFHELHNEMSGKHLETKQYYTLPHGREDFIRQFESIVDGVKSAQDKVRHKYNEERMRRDELNEELQSLLELQRQYALAVKQLTRECQRCEQLQQELSSTNSLPAVHHGGGFVPCVAAFPPTSSHRPAMWTYMMAAARGDRVNTMMSSRRRPETESPKYGYNLSTRPMYRTTRFVGPASSAPAQLQLPCGSHQASVGVAPPPLEEISGGLFAPFAPTATITVEQAATSIPMAVDGEVHHLTIRGNHRRAGGDAEEEDEDEDDDDDDEDDVDEDEDEFGAAVGVDNPEEAIARADQQQKQHHQPHASDSSYVENGRKLIQEPNKRSKPSALRRTLQALRQRLTKRNRPKPPDWFLEKFSNTTNTDKIGKDPALSSEIRGSSVLCNRLSVDPTLQSHYRWLAIVSLAVLYNIIFVMGRAVFWEINKSAPAVWYTLDYLCDFIYLLDTLVHMHEGFLDQGLLVRDAFRLRRHYFHTKGWYLDVLSMLPTDLAYFWWPPETCSSLYLPCPVIVRLNRLLRINRLWEWFDRTETATGYEIGFSSDSWVYNLNGTRNNTLQRQYIYSFYWSTLTLTTIGETPTPENDVEYLFVVADFLAGVLIFATIVGNIGSMISNMNVARVEFQNRMDGVKQYMAFRRVGHELEARVIRWFAYTWSQSGALDEERVLAALPDKLKAEIAIQVRIFHDTEPGLLEALVLKLKLQVFSPGDYICRKGDVGKEMYIVKRGKLSVVGDDGITVLATLGAGSVFGEIAGNRTGNRRTANVRSLGYSDLFCLAKRDLWETLSDYPEARSTLTQRGCQLLRKDGLLDEQIFADSQRVHDSIEGGIEKLELSVENLNMRLARLLAEYTASQAKIKQRLAKLEMNGGPGTWRLECEPQTRVRSGRLYSLQPKRRPRSRPDATAKIGDAAKQNTL
ncbi:hypothetical protein M5D96_008412 [Drosophila gunungcola]|uniref:Cyclic nucleotide-binding domain-containing protein n=1 Tax=Drosophila gunungcola TaxID=103775 RepID=A0A9Q0BNA3_9MUSC|nr:hypothetical protein M5D96_008412 [Drosophila gunungcola]